MELLEVVSAAVKVQSGDLVHHGEHSVREVEVARFSLHLHHLADESDRLPNKGLLVIFLPHLQELLELLQAGGPGEHLDDVVLLRVRAPGLSSVLLVVKAKNVPLHLCSEVERTELLDEEILLAGDLDLLQPGDLGLGQLQLLDLVQDGLEPRREDRPVVLGCPCDHPADEDRPLPVAHHPQEALPHFSQGEVPGDGAHAGGDVAHRHDDQTVDHCVQEHVAGPEVE